MYKLTLTASGQESKLDNASKRRRKPPNLDEAVRHHTRRSERSSDSEEPRPDGEGPTTVSRRGAARLALGVTRGQSSQGQENPQSDSGPARNAGNQASWHSSWGNPRDVEYWRRSVLLPGPEVIRRASIAG